MINVLLFARYNWSIQVSERSIENNNIIEQTINERVFLSLFSSLETWQSILKTERTGLIDCHYWITHRTKRGEERRGVKRLSWHIRSHSLAASKFWTNRSKENEKRTTFSHRIRHPSEIVWSKAQLAPRDTLFLVGRFKSVLFTMAKTNLFKHDVPDH